MTESFSPDNLDDIEEKVRAGERLSAADGLRLYRVRGLIALGRLAQITRRRINGSRVFYSVNLHLNYSNVCSGSCLFCAFAKKAGEPGAYTLDLAAIRRRVRVAAGRWRINEVHIVGGQHPDLAPDYYLEMVRRIREDHPGLYIKALTAPEVHDIARRSGIPVGELLAALKKNGLDGLAGGGAEIFAGQVRKKICPDKISADEWLAVHRAAHEAGLGTNATMLYGHVENDEDRVDHVLRLRELQDRTRGFRSFIPLAYKAGNNRLGGGAGESGGYLDLKVLAVSRLLLDNIPHIKVHWGTVGLKMGQVALSFGVDDLGGTHLGEKVMHDAGSEAPVTLAPEELEDLIRKAGYQPCRVDSSYQWS